MPLKLSQRSVVSLLLTTKHLSLVTVGKDVGSGHEADHIHPSVDEFKNAWSLTSTPLYNF